ncbi:MAG: efflux RND transporter permease subunit [Terriglobales bacterium]
MFVNFFIRRPVFAIVCSLLIILAGAIAIPTLPIAQFPVIAPPVVSVSAVYNGANSQAVETSVTTLLEQAINGAEGMRYLSSTSANDGSSQVTATFDLTRNVDIAAVDVQNRAFTAMGRLPAEVQTTGLSVFKNSGSFIMAVGVYSEDKRYDNLFISNYLDVYVKDALKRVKGVGDVMIFGERKYAMRLWLDPARMAARKLTAADVVSALREQNVQVAAGQVGQAPAIPGQSFQISVRAAGRLSGPREFENIVLKRGPDGSLVMLRDIGRAELGAESYEGNLKYNGHEALGLGVMQLSNANALEVDKGVREELARLAKNFPPGLKYEIAFDITTAVGESIREVLITLALAIIVVILVIFLFLQTWRSTLIPAITIPVSLIGTFAFVKLFGFSINTLTLFGITLATGLVVDDAIVVIENVERHMEEGIGDARRASQVAMGEVTGAVIATSLVLIAVFLPVALFPGTTGRMYQQFALTIAFSIALSAFNALTLTPSLSALLLRPTDREKQNAFFRGINALIRGGTHSYRNWLGHVSQWKLPILAIFVLALLATWWMYRKVPTSFVPEEDQGYFMVIVQGPPGASVNYTSRVTDRASEILAQNPDITGIFAVPGFSFGGAAPNRGIIFINLKESSERKGAAHSAQAIINSVRGPLMGITEALVIPFSPPPIEGLGEYGGFQFQLQQTGSGTLEEMQNVLEDLMRKGNQRPELRGLFSSFSARDPQFLVSIDREKAKGLGVPFSQITSALQVFMGSQYVNDFDFNNRSYRVYVQADKEFRSHPHDLREFYVRADDGKMVPLDDIVTVKETTNASIISHYNLFRTAAINGSAAPGYSSGQAIKAMNELASQLPVGYSYEWTGLSLEEIESGAQAFLLFGLGLLVVYLTLSAQYESFVLPFIILLAVPMAVLGALGAQWLRGQQNDVYCQIGLVMLIGLASKNAILIVEFAEQLQARGLSLVEATVEAARLRLRPILMTSVAFILGVLPLVFATGAGSAGRHSVGTTVFGGMILSTLLNLFIIPVLYLLVRSLIPAKRESREAISESPAD